MEECVIPDCFVTNLMDLSHNLHIYECIFIYSFIYTVSTEVDHRHFLFAVSFQIYSKFVFLIDLTHLGRLLPDQIIPLTN